MGAAAKREREKEYRVCNHAAILAKLEAMACVPTVQMFCTSGATTSLAVAARTFIPRKGLNDCFRKPTPYPLPNKHRLANLNPRLLACRQS